MMKRLLMVLTAAALLFSGLTGFALAVEPDEKLDDPILEERARVISRDLRCVVCQNQSIDDSSAPLARDLRLIIRERLLAGDDNEQVVAFVVDRYGDFVLLKPPFQGETYLLWFGPALILLGGGALVIYYYRKVLKTVDGKAKK